MSKILSSILLIMLSPGSAMLHFFSGQLVPAKVTLAGIKQPQVLQVLMVVLKELQLLQIASLCFLTSSFTVFNLLVLRKFRHQLLYLMKLWQRL